MTKICIAVGEKILCGELNDTTAAKEFCKKLPFSVTCRRNTIEYYSSTPRGVFDPMDISLGFMEGDIILWDGWLRFPYVDAQGKYIGQKNMVIGHLNDVSELKKLPGNIKILVKEDKED